MAPALLPAALAALFCATLLWTIKLLITSWSNPLNKIPGPVFAKWSDLGLKLATISGQRIYYVDSLHKQYGPYVRLSPGEVSVADPQAFAQIHRALPGYCKAPWYLKFATWSRPVLFSMTSNKDHAARRKVLARGFSKTYLRQHWESVVHEKVLETVQKLKKEALTGTADILKWWTLMAADVTCQLSFGSSDGMVSRGERTKYIRVLQSMVKGTGIRVEMPLVGFIGRRIPTATFQDMFNSHSWLADYALRAATASKSESGSKNMFATIVEAAEKGERLDDDDVRFEASAMIIAGTDTTAISLTYLVWAVLQQPTLQYALQQEVASLPNNFTEQDTEDLPILSSTIEETLRLYCAAPGGLPRSVPDEGVALGGYFFPPGSVVTTQAYTLHRDPTVFPRPDVFDHTRWLTTGSTSDSSVKFNPAAAPTYSPFGAGARICLGINLARMELRLGAVEFFRHCGGARLASSTTAESMEMENYFLISPKAHRCEITLR